MERKILILGASGQIGTVLYSSLVEEVGVENVFPSDIRSVDLPQFLQIDALDKEKIRSAVRDHQISEIYHMVAILSAKGEREPRLAWNINMRTLFNVLEISVDEKVDKVFFPSSIAVFGGSLDLNIVDQLTPLFPQTVYGISKVAGENWCSYFRNKFDLDVRSLRFPGIIGHESLPGGGTTDYAVHVFHEVIKSGHYKSFLSEDTRLPMMYMPDAINSIKMLMAARRENLSCDSSYNVTAFSFSPKELFGKIKMKMPKATFEYDPDYRQNIADKWPNIIDDSLSREDWNWKPSYNMDQMIDDMIAKLKKKYSTHKSLI
jgi:nucleoside-diphosphate-sugar epimerase